MSVQSWVYSSPSLQFDGEMIEIKCSEECDCEHCGKLEPYNLVFDDGGTTWCEYCMDTNDNLPDDEMLDEAREHSRQCKIKYFEQRLEDLKNG